MHFLCYSYVESSLCNIMQIWDRYERPINCMAILDLFLEVKKVRNVCTLYKMVIPFTEGNTADGSTDGVKHTAEMETKAQLLLQREKNGSAQSLPTVN